MCEEVLVIADAPNPRPHVQLRVFAHGVGVSLGPAVIGFDRVLEALGGRLVLPGNALGCFEATEEIEGGF